MNTTKLIGKKAKIQVMEDGVLPDWILKTCEENNLNPVALLNKELTIEDIHEEKFQGDVEPSEYFCFKETKRFYYGEWKRYYLPSKYFQIAMNNHPLTDIFSDYP